MSLPLGKARDGTSLSIKLTRTLRQLVSADKYPAPKATMKSLASGSSGLDGVRVIRISLAVDGMGTLF